MGFICYVRGCEGHKRRTSKAFHKFGISCKASAKVRLAWLAKIPREEEQPAFDFRKHRLCHLHFEEKFLVKPTRTSFPDGSYNRMRWGLKPEAVPTRFPRFIVTSRSNLEVATTKRKKGGGRRSVNSKRAMKKCPPAKQTATSSKYLCLLCFTSDCDPTVSPEGHSERAEAFIRFSRVVRRHLNIEAAGSRDDDPVANMSTRKAATAGGVSITLCEGCLPRVTEVVRHFIVMERARMLVDHELGEIVRNLKQKEGSGVKKSLEGVSKWLPSHVLTPLKDLSDLLKDSTAGSKLLGPPHVILKRHVTAATDAVSTSACVKETEPPTLTSLCDKAPISTAAIQRTVKEKPFSCRICDKCFPTEADLKSHNITFHSTQEEETVSGGHSLVDDLEGNPEAADNVNDDIADELLIDSNGMVTNDDYFQVVATVDHNFPDVELLALPRETRNAKVIHRRTVPLRRNCKRLQLRGPPCRKHYYAPKQSFFGKLRRRNENVQRNVTKTAGVWIQEVKRKIKTQQLMKKKNSRLFYCQVKNCGAKFFLQASLDCHSKAHSEMHCHFCKHWFPEAEELLTHEMQHSEHIVSEDCWATSCPRCETVARSPAFLLTHFAERHLHLRPSKKEQVRRLFFSACGGRGFDDTRKYQTNNGSAICELPHPCSRCERRFATETGLNLHQWNHTTTKSFSESNKSLKFQRKCIIKRQLRNRLRGNSGAQIVEERPKSVAAVAGLIDDRGDNGLSR